MAATDPLESSGPLLAILLARIGYRLRHSPPALPAKIGAFSQRFSSPVHLVLYALGTARADSGILRGNTPLSSKDLLLCLEEVPFT
jgi:cytochrome b561